MGKTVATDGQYPVVYDLGSTYARRVRIMMLVSSVVLAALGTAWAVYFGLARDAILFTVGIAMDGARVAIGLLGRAGRLRAASLLLALVMYAVLIMLCGLVEIPDAMVPRSLHTFFLIMAVGAQHRRHRVARRNSVGRSGAGGHWQFPPGV